MFAEIATAKLHSVAVALVVRMFEQGQEEPTVVLIAVGLPTFYYAFDDFFST